MFHFFLSCTLSWAFSVVRGFSWWISSPENSAGRSHTFTVQSWLPVATKDAFILDTNKDRNSLLRLDQTRAVTLFECRRDERAQLYLEQLMEPTALVWLEPWATHRTWPLSLSICQTRTDRSYTQTHNIRMYTASWNDLIHCKNACAPC